MKLNKHIALIALVAGGLLAAGTVSAQDAPKEKPPGAAPGGPGGMRPPSPEKLAEALGLSAEQTPKFKAALEERQKKMQELRADAALSQEDKRAKGKEIRDAANTKVKEILTPAQYEKYTKLAPAQRPRPGVTPPPAAEKPADKPAGERTGKK